MSHELLGTYLKAHHGQGVEGDKPKQEVERAITILSEVSNSEINKILDVGLFSYEDEIHYQIILKSGWEAMKKIADKNKLKLNVGGFVERLIKEQGWTLQKILENFKFNLDFRFNKERTTPLMSAVETGDLTLVRSLLKQGASIDFDNKYKQTPFVIAVLKTIEGELGAKTQFQIMELLLQHKANINVKDEDGRTLLMYASLEGKLHVVKFLVEHHADLNLIDEKGKTALELIQEENSRLVDYPDPNKLAVAEYLSHASKLFVPSFKSGLDKPVDEFPEGRPGGRPLASTPGGGGPKQRKSE